MHTLVTHEGENATQEGRNTLGRTLNETFKSWEESVCMDLWLHLLAFISVLGHV